MTTRRWPFPFVFGAVVLGVAAVGLDPAIAGLQRWTRKEIVAPRRPIPEFAPDDLPSFEARPDGVIVGVAETDDVGTTEQFMQVVAQTSHGDEGDPGRESVLFLTYYSDPEASIPHTPEVCYRQFGATILGDTTMLIRTPELAPAHEDLTVRRLVLDIDGKRSLLLYVLVAEGKIRAGREGARWTLGLPGAKRTYFSKVEVVTKYTGDDDRIDAGAALLLRETLAELFANYYPDVD